MAILGMGKLGSRELTAGSDVDLILLTITMRTPRNWTAKSRLRLRITTRG